MLIAVLFKAVQIENNPNIHQLESTECSYNEIVIKIQKKKTHKILISGHSRGESLKNYIKWESQMEQMILFM